MSGIIQIVGQTSGVSHLLAVDSSGAIKSADASLLSKNTEIEVSCDAILAKNTEILAKNAEIETSVDALIAANHTDLVALEASADALIAANHTDLVAIEASADALIAANHTDLVAINSTLGGTLSVSAPVISTTSSVIENATSVVSGSTELSSSVDAGAVRRVAVFGSLDDTSGVIKVQVSADNSTFYENSEQSVYVDSSSNQFYKTIELDARYVRLSYENSSGGAKTWTAILSYKA